MFGQFSAALKRSCSTWLGGLEFSGRGVVLHQSSSCKKARLKGKWVLNRQDVQAFFSNEGSGGR